MTFAPVPIIRILVFIACLTIINKVSAQVNCRIILSNAADSTQKVAILHQRNFIETFHRPFKTFSITITDKDTLIFMSRGYQSRIITGSDLLNRKGITDIYLTSLNLLLHEVRIKPMIALDSLALRSKHIGLIPDEFKPAYPEINALSSPLTALWSQFNSLERQKRKIAELIKEKDMHDIMVAYLDICNKRDIINLPLEDYDDFIHYAHFTPETLRYNTQYDVLNTIRYLYVQYMNLLHRGR